jgi:hypothetical protein
MDDVVVDGFLQSLKRLDIVADVGDVTVLGGYSHIDKIPVIDRVLVSLVVPLADDYNRIIVLTPTRVLKTVGYLHVGGMHLDFVIGVGRHDG